MTISEVSITFGAESRRLKYRKGSSDEATVSQVFVDRCYDLSWLKRFDEFRRLAEAKAREGRRPLIVDCGANIGAASLFFAMNVRGAAVAAVEPSRENYELLVENTQGLDVRTFHAAIAAAPGRMQVLPGEGSYDSFRTRAADALSGPADTVPALTVPDILAAYGDGYFPFIVKVDIEGGEKDLFSANTGWVADVPILVIELHDWLLPAAGTALPFLRCVAALDRDFLVRGENVFSLAAPRG
ncbi:FkbM family methyltransferase [Azospirillum sp.]|uniref:FkbM family methyltransferase n=1 Tax=Azospirillum sp. TaxID=34012 RepID=UPI003D75F5A4